MSAPRRPTFHRGLTPATIQSMIDDRINAYDKRLRKQLEKGEQMFVPKRQQKQEYLRALLGRRLADVEIGELRFLLSQIPFRKHNADEPLGEILGPQQEQEQVQQRGPQ
ncbi:MAG: hypothetical protein KIT09_02155 [Bryobacteraceae bacterium]|nr:hypothetical protein [Bryobacteraceae bacterium]